MCIFSLQQQEMVTLDDESMMGVWSQQVRVGGIDDVQLGDDWVEKRPFGAAVQILACLVGYRCRLWGACAARAGANAAQSVPPPAAAEPTR